MVMVMVLVVSVAGKVLETIQEAGEGASF